MLSRHTPLLVKGSVLAESESFGFSRMTDRREIFLASIEKGESDTIDHDVTNLSGPTLQRRDRSVSDDLEIGEPAVETQKFSDASLNQAGMASLNATGEQGESSTTYVAPLRCAPLHHIPDSQSRPRLTLSAFRRPEESVRVADPDSSRKLTDSYKLCGGIGHGAMSTVRLAERICDGSKFAVKTVSKHEVLRTRRFGRRRRHMDEWEVLRLLEDNPYVVNLIDVYETDDEVQMVLEYCDGGELFEHIQRNRAKPTPYAQSEVQAAKITEQILSVLNDLHVRGIVHRDVKPENLLLTSIGGSEAKVCDFGIARLLLDECDSESCSSDDEGVSPGRRRAYSRVGSDLYAAPEVCLGDGYGTAVDMYSLGVTLYVLLYGFPPIFDLQDDGEAGVTFHDNQWSQISDDAKDLIRQMLEADPEQRITAESALNSPWIKRHAGPRRYPVTNGRIAVQRRASHRFSLSPGKPRPPVDLELVKARLYKNMEVDRKRVKPGMSGSRKRRRMAARVERLEQPKIEGDVLMSMADLYRGVALAAVSATNAAKGVVYDDRKITVNVLVDDCNDELSDDDADSMLALSV